MIKRKSFISAPAILNTSDAAMWITGWNEAVDALEAEQAQAVEPTLTTKTEQIAGAISRHISTPLIQREVLAAAQYIAHRYAHPAPPPAGERAELVTALLECLAGPAALTTREATAIKDAANMLEADGSLINEDTKAQQVAVPLRECHYESPTLRVCNKCGQRHDKAIFASQGAKP